MYDMERPWHRVVRRAAMYRVYGYSWQEWIAKKRDDGVIGYLDIEPRTQSTITRWEGLLFLASYGCYMTYWGLLATQHAALETYTRVMLVLMPCVIFALAAHATFEFTGHRRGRTIT